MDIRLIWQKSPGNAAANSNRYYCTRKEKFSSLLMAIADADLRFVWFDVSCKPNTHDSLAFLTTDLGQRIVHNELKYIFFLLVDSAFICGMTMITSGVKDNFNLEHSSMRINGVCTFG